LIAVPLVGVMKMICVGSGVAWAQEARRNIKTDAVLKTASVCLSIVIAFNKRFNRFRICRVLMEFFKSYGCVSNELDPVTGRLFSVFWALETFVLRVASTQMKHTLSI
jgi:hypothetical protein